jgi:hypothetical protein
MGKGKRQRRVAAKIMGCSFRDIDLSLQCELVRKKSFTLLAT